MRRIFIALSISALFLAMNASPTPAYPGLPTPDEFKGYVKRAYEGANQFPQLAKNLFCYCGCDQEKAHHKKLLDCFMDGHAEACGICQDEMVRAAGYKNQGMPEALIAKKIDAEFKHEYPYPNPSAALKSYQVRHPPARKR
jgi:hypothetical protein